MYSQNYKKLYPKVFNFCEILKMCKQILENPQTFFLCFILYKVMLTFMPQLIVKIEDGHEHHKNLVLNILSSTNTKVKN